MATILIVDDERLLCDLLQNQLRSHGHEALSAYTGREGLVLFRQRRPRFTILDLTWRVLGGLKCFRRFRDWAPPAPGTFLRGHRPANLKRQPGGSGQTNSPQRGFK